LLLTYLLTTEAHLYILLNSHWHWIHNLHDWSCHSSLDEYKNDGKNWLNSTSSSMKLRQNVWSTTYRYILQWYFSIYIIYTFNI